MKKRHTLAHTFLGLALLTSAILTAAVETRAQTCPPGQPVCHTITPMGGHGAASALPGAFNCNCPSDNRRVITINIDASWGNPTNANIWNAVQCAIGEWNAATDGANPPNQTGYYLQLDQGHQVSNPADMTISQLQPSTSPFAESGIGANGWYMHLAPINATLNGGTHPAADLCGRLAHEFGHMLGLNGISVDCYSVMHSSNADGTRSWNAVTSQDVFQVNRNFDNTTRTNGYCKPPQNLSDDPSGEGGGDPGGDPCGGDPCCGDLCCQDPSYCGGDDCQWVEYCTQVCWYETYCGVADACSGDCIYWQDELVCDPPDCHSEYECW